MQRRFPSRNQWLTISWTKTDRGQFHCESIHHFELLSSLCSVKKSSRLFNKVKETFIPLFLYLSSGFFCQPPSNFQPSGGKNLSWGSSNWKEDIKDFMSPPNEKYAQRAGARFDLAQGICSWMSSHAKREPCPSSHTLFTCVLHLKVKRNNNSKENNPWTFILMPFSLWGADDHIIELKSPERLLLSRVFEKMITKNN